MAQKLKEELREAIINAAREEFLEHGYEDASMRRIAAKAGITVGNIYRYFRNKEDLSRYILADTSKDIGGILDGLRIENLSKQPRVFNMKTDPAQLSKMMDEFAEQVVYLYLNKREEFNIIMNDEKQNRKIKNWFSQTFSSLIDQPYTVIDFSKERNILADAYASAAFAGMKQIFQEADDDEQTLFALLRLYLRRFINMVCEEIRNGNGY